MNIFLEAMCDKLQSSEIPDNEINNLLTLAGQYAALYPDEQEVQDAFNKVKEIIRNKRNGVENDSQQNISEAPSQMSVSDVVNKLGELRKLQDQPAAYFEECSKILSSPKDVTLAEQAIYGLGKIVEKHPEEAEKALKVMELCKDNKQLSAIDTSGLIDTALFNNMYKIVVANPSLTERALDSLASYKMMAVIRPDMAQPNKKVMEIDENKLPQLRLGGEYGITYNLNTIAQDISRLKPGETLAIGRNPQDVEYTGASVIVGAENPHVSRRHCDIRRNEKGKLELVDLSVNGTKILPPLTEQENVNAAIRPDMAQPNKKVMEIDENKLPQLRLGGEYGITYNLNTIAQDISRLKPGETLAIGRKPQDGGYTGASVIVGAENLHVSRHHCDIRRNEKGKLELVDLSVNGTKILPPLKEQENVNAVIRPDMAQPNKKVMEIDENKLPQLRLGGEYGITYNLNTIAQDISRLKPGETLAIGRKPQDVGYTGASVIVGAENLHVSRHHCDIRRNEKGKLELVDLSANGTKILPPLKEQENVNADNRPPLANHNGTQGNNSHPAKGARKPNDTPPMNNMVMKQRMQQR